MNEFTVKKMAEVQAFVDLSKTILAKSDPNLTEQFSNTSDALRSIGSHRRFSIADKQLAVLFETKTQKTLAKLTQMMELYIGDEWDDPIEVSEWLSFYAGSASAHAALTTSALNVLGFNDERDQSSQLSEAFWQLLITVKTNLSDSGAKRAQK